jgi:hypothetical protein
MTPDVECEFGPIEYDQARYCHTHGVFLEPWHEIRTYCPRAIELAAEQRRAQAIERENQE